jgi:thiol-disulfide isomerase/thioredoxin
MIIGVSAFVLLFVLVAILYNSFSQQAPPETIGTSGQENTSTSDTNSNKNKPKATDFTMTDSSGNSGKLSDLIANGKPIVLNFWASWCDPCKNEMPAFNKVYQELGGDIQFVMVDLTDGQRETKEIGAKYITDQGYTFPVYFDTLQEGSLAYNIRGIPTTLFLDKDGYIINSVQHGLNEQLLRQYINSIKP